MLMMLQTIVGTQSYTIHRNEEAFPKGEDFLPERWLDESGDELQKEAFVPFSVGKRSCIGIKYVSHPSDAWNHWLSC